MKYNTIGTVNEEKKASLTIYADMDIPRNKVVSNEAEISTIRNELENVQKALKFQTRRCRLLVTEYTRRLQQKEQQYQSEKALREDQLAKVLRALIIFEARLKQEQKFISNQLKEKDIIIKKQSNEIKKLLANQYCKNCNQYYSESMETDYQSSNFESLDSSSDIYATVSEKSYNENKFPKKGSLESLPTEKNENSDDDEKKTKITDSIPVFEGDGETNDNWYASASDQEDDERRDIYRNNPVLECMNQILLQNINDAINSPPKTPNTERKSLKKVKFSDEEEKTQLTEENLKDCSSHGYYETPIQKVPNFYETPQSIYSNDYEQILSKCSEEKMIKSVLKNPDHFYVDLDKKSDENNRKVKMSRTPPALPPKPANLILKYKLNKVKNEEISESEPDYCSISELNLPTNKNLSFKKINVVAEINSPNSQDVLSKLDKTKKKLVESEYDPVAVPKKSIMASKKTEPEIPKLPQVSEIIIPEENDERISHDNYVKNNSQILKLKNKFENNRRSIIMGTSVSSLISGFNNQIISELNKKPEKKTFSSFENLQNLDKVDNSFELSQNFEEFKLDDCEIEEYIPDITEEEIQSDDDKKSSLTRVELIRATNDPLLAPNLNTSSVEMLKKQLELQKNKVLKENPREPTYEHFLECTGLSSKSILTPSRLLSNHKSMLKPKDIKLRSKVNKANLFDRNSTNTVKYWSEPYI